MKFDMHCHTKEGSIDARVDIESYIKKLISQGFDGMLVTDHNSYDGYRKWKEIAHTLEKELEKPFTVLKGIEYDTRDAGHMIVVLPDEVHCKLLEARGMTVEKLEKIVHELGGIFGPAHPYGTGFFALMNTKYGKKNKEMIHKFDFIETFNACNHLIDNVKAKSLAARYKKPSFAGSDAHFMNVVGSAFTKFDKEIRNNNDLIRLVREKAQILADGSLLEKYQKNNLIKKYPGVVGYWIYNKVGALVYTPARHRGYKQLGAHAKAC